MKAMKPVLFMVLLLLVVLGLQQSLFIVDQTQQALVIQLGHPLDRVYRPGLHVKIPFIQKVVYFEARILDYDARPAEALTSDLKSIVLDNYARWKIVDPLRFYRTMRTEHNAQARLDAVIYSQIRAHIGRHTLTQVVADERTSIMDSVTEKASQQMKEFGIEIVDVRIKRTDLPAETSVPFLIACAPSVNGRLRSIGRKARRNQPRSVPERTRNAQSFWQRPTSSLRC